MLHPVWEPTTSGEPASDEWLARCLLGQGWVGGTGKLTMLDLRVWAALCAMLREQLNGEPPSDDPTLDRGTSRIVQATGYELAAAFSAARAADSGGHCGGPSPG